MSKRIVICVPDSYVNMVERFMSAQAHKGLSFSVLVAMAMKSYGATDIIGPALMGSGLSSISASHLASLFSGGLDASTPKRKRGRPKKSPERIIEDVPRRAEGVAAEYAAKPGKEPVKHSDDEEKQTKAPKVTSDVSQRDVPNSLPGSSRVYDPEPVSEEKPYQPYKEEGAKERSGWSDDAFDGIDPDFNPDGGLDNVFELLGGNG